jgi:hypothetical protein
MHILIKAPQIKMVNFNPFISLFSENALNWIELNWRVQAACRINIQYQISQSDNITLAMMNPLKTFFSLPCKRVKLVCPLEEEQRTKLHRWSFRRVEKITPYLLTPWCRISFENLIVIQLVKKYPAFLRNPKVHHHVHKSPPLDPNLSKPNPVRPIDSYLNNVHLNVILPPTPRFFQWSRPFGTPNHWLKSKEVICFLNYR